MKTEIETKDNPKQTSKIKILVGEGLARFIVSIILGRLGYK